MKMSEIVLVKYLFQTDWEPLEDVIEANSQDFGDIYEFDNDKEVIQVAKTSSATLVIACVKTKEDLTKLLNFLKLSNKVLKDSSIKVSVLNYLQNKNVETALMKLGCQEVLDPNLKSKPLKFKIDFWKKSLAVAVNKRLGEETKTVKDLKLEKDNVKKEVPQIKWGEPLKVVDDMWITKSPQDTKRVLNRWMIKLMGPSPFVAQWVEVSGQKGLWQFVFKNGIREDFHMSDGDWFFRGEQKPEFVWKENLWLVSGKNIQLFFQDDEAVVAKFRTYQENLEISKNSNYALSREKAIVETFDQEVLVKKGVTDDSKTSVDPDQKIKQGKLSEDIDGNDKLDGHIKGRNSKEKAIEDKKHNVGRNDLNLDNLKGESSTEDLGGDHYDGKVDNQRKNKKDPNLSNAKSDSLFDEGGNAGTDDMGPQKYKGKLEHTRSERKSEYGAEASTDDLGDAKGTNQNEGAGKKNREADEKQGKEERGPQDEASRVNNVKDPKIARKKASDVWDEDSEEHDSSGDVAPVKAKSDPIKPASLPKAFDDLAENDKDVALSPELKKERAEKAKAEIFDEEEASVSPEKRKEKIRGAREKGTWSDDEEKGNNGKSSPGIPRPSNDEDANEEKVPVKLAKKHLALQGTKDVEEENDDADSEKNRPVSKKAIQGKNLGQGTDNLGNANYAGKVAKKTASPFEGAEDIVDERFEGTDLTTRFEKEVAKGKINNKTRSQLDVLDVDESQEKEPENETGVASGKRVKNVKTSVAFDDENVRDEVGEEELKGAGAEALRAVKNDKKVTSPEQSTAPIAREKSLREKKMKSLDDLLPEGNAYDPAEEVLPKVVDEVQVDRQNATGTKSQSDKPEVAGGEKVSAKAKEVLKQPNLQLVPKLETPALTDDGKPIVTDSAKVRAFIQRISNQNQELEVHVDDFFENKAILKTMSKELKTNEVVSLVVVFEYIKRSKRISVQGKCIEVNKEDEETYVTLELSPEDQKVFEQFIRLYQLRQEHVTDFMKAAKGY
jgi:hypothetical protein